MKKKIFKIKGMHCTNCALMIESDLEDAGVKACCNYAKQTLEVEFDEKKLGADTIERIVIASGYKIMVH